MIPLDQIQQIKQEAELKQVVESLGVELKRAGANYVGRCPFHNEKPAASTSTLATSIGSATAAARAATPSTLL